VLTSSEPVETTQRNHPNSVVELVETTQQPNPNPVVEPAETTQRNNPSHHPSALSRTSESPRGRSPRGLLWSILKRRYPKFDVEKVSHEAIVPWV